MAVRIRMKKLGRRHRPFFRICAMDSRAPRDGRVLEELGTYDPMLRDTDARAILKSDRIDYWLSVGAQPSDNVKVLIKKYGSQGTHLDQQKVALEQLKPKSMSAPQPETEDPKPDSPEVEDEPVAVETSEDAIQADKASAEDSGPPATE